MKWQIRDALGSVRFATDDEPCDTREQAEYYISLYDADPEAMEENPEWFPMYVVGVDH